MTGPLPISLAGAPAGAEEVRKEDLHLIPAWCFDRCDLLIDAS